MDWLTTSPTLPLYLGCVLLAALMLWQHRCVKQLLAATKRLRAVFPDVGPAGTLKQRRPPLALPLGSPLPEFRVAAIHGGTGNIDRSMLIGKAALLVFVRLGDFERWPVRVAAGMLTALQTRTGAAVYMFLASGENEDYASFRFPTLADGGLLVAADRTGSFWNALGIERTPCVIELNDAGVIQRVGMIEDPVAGERLNGGTHD